MPYDVIIVLAGGIRDDGSLPENVKRRIQIAKGLFSQKKAPLILMSGRWSALRAKKNDLPFFTEASAMATYAHSLGIPLSRILKEESSTNTFENALYCARTFIKPRNWKKIIVVSSDFHLARVKRMFSLQLGPSYTLTYVGSPTDFSLFRRILLSVAERINHAVAYLKELPLFRQ